MASSSCLIFSDEIGKNPQLSIAITRIVDHTRTESNSYRLIFLYCVESLIVIDHILVLRTDWSRLNQIIPAQAPTKSLNEIIQMCLTGVDWIVAPHELLSLSNESSPVCAEKTSHEKDRDAKCNILRKTHEMTHLT
jgi:hypothetical protein